MEIVFHIGANCTDDDKLLKTMLKNADTLSAHGVKAPGPGKYRRLIRETIQNLNGAPPAPNTRQILLDAVLDDEAARRLVMSNSNFICIPNRVFDNGVFYQQTEFKVRGLTQLFPDDDLTICIGLRDPATFLPDAFSASKADSFDAYLQGMHVLDIRWSDVIRRILYAAPNANLIVWCNEDTPMIWADLVRKIAGLPPRARITGGFDLLASIMSAEGMNRFLNYMKAHPPTTISQKHRIIGAFLDKYAIEDEVEKTVDLPGITEEDLEDLSDHYEEDVLMIAEMPGVTFIQP